MKREPDLLDLPTRELIARLSATDPPGPGGGSAAAVAAAMAAAVAAMAARVSAREWPEGRAYAAQAEALRARAEPLAQADADAYGRVLQLLRSPDVADRDAALGEALSLAARIPLRIAEVAADVVDVAAEVAARGSPSLRPDAVAAAVLGAAATRIGAQLVAVNLMSTPGDERLERARELATRADAAVARLAD